MKQILTAPFKLAQNKNAAPEAVLRNGAAPLTGIVTPSQAVAMMSMM